MSPQTIGNAASEAPDRTGGFISDRWRRLRVRPLAAPAAFAWLGLLLSIIFLLRQLGLADPSVLNMWISSDTLYPVNVFTDIFVDGYSLSGWQFSIAPCWFPDLVLVGLFFALTRNVIMATLLAGCIQIGLIIGAFAIIRSAVRTAGEVTQDVVLPVVGIGIALIVAMRPGMYYPGLYQFFLPQTHVGSMWVVLFAVGLALLWIRRIYDGTRVTLPLMVTYGVVCLLGGMSNVLFLVHMLVPLTGSLIFASAFGMLPASCGMLPLGLGWGAAFSGAILNRVLFNTTGVSTQSSVTYETALLALDVFMRGLVAKVIARDILHLLALVWAIVCLSYVAISLRKAVRQGLSTLSVTERMTTVFFLFNFLSAICSIGAIIAGGSNGLTVFKDYNWTLHYMHPAFLVPLFGVPLAFSWIVPLNKVRSFSRAMMAGSVAAAILPVYLLCRGPLPATPIHLYTPPLVRFIDNLAVSDGLRYGLGGYWQTRLVTLLSARGVRAYAVAGSLSPLLWVSNRQWYSELLGNKAPHPVDFIILDDPLWKISREDAVRVFGDPVREVSMNSTRVLIYARRTPAR